MTTIVATPAAIYADSAVSVGEEMFRAVKIFRIRGRLVGCAGDNSLISVFLDALRRGRKPVKPDNIMAGEADFDALIVDRRGIWHYDVSFTVDQVDEPFMAIGTGSAAARGAMMAGADPVAAILIASRIDRNTRGPVRYLLLDDPRQTATVVEDAHNHA